ncbi:hypothetical protein AX769_07535 [Frondihabitans sp. PAMC 28766]|uniref:hypothetical protein n=1 Tax=Frondihabitans sp. PAMC 28766 TaxID=1795630 RepID=UPI00078CCA4B|nr:hypothetical protein [Frondihabitans sp. PAMC 28766]AMM18906.1 hypothetical protein AX769_00570 [Frondihabitans sp. PAMC 28766]AMM20043.1 hypothetical protein AX769_07535 [Frondihabitans sp. PAMC 28766]
MRKISKAGISFAAAAVLVAGVAGVGVTQANAASTHLAAAKSIPAPAAAVPAVLGGTTGVALDSNFLAALKSLKLTPSVYGTAKLTGSDITFPITGGSVVYWSPKSNYRPYVQGILEHDGSGLTLTSGATSVTLADFTINPGNSLLYGDVSVNGKVAAVQAPLFNLHGGTLKPLQLQGKDAILTGTTVHVSSTAASLLDSTFKTTAVKADLLVGVATITAQISK